MAKCKLCGKETKTKPLKSGKYVECDPDKVNYIKNGEEVIITPDGEVVRCTTVDSSEGADGWGYVPHLATCKGGIW